jgi:hypothetical protein
MNFKLYPKKLILPAFIAAMVLASGSARAQTSDTNTTTDFSAFQVIPQMNIFNPSREPNRPMDYHRTEPQVVPEFTLAGTMSYRKGMFAFFNGTDPEYQEAVQEGGTIAGFTVTNISLAGIQLLSPSMNTNMMVGAAMQKDGTNWDLNNDEVSTMSSPSSYGDFGGGRVGRGRRNRGGRERMGDYNATSTAPAAVESAPAPSSDLGGSDVLKRLMQQRQQEEK